MRSGRFTLAGVLLVAASVVTTAGVASAASETVEVRDNSFSPSKLTVDAGDSVTWKWVGANAHNVVTKKAPKKFKSKVQSKGTYTQTLKKPGKYTIYCTLHSGMDMKITVEKAAPATTAATTTTTAAR